MQPWLYLGIAIVSEVIGTSALKAAEGFTRPWPSLVVIVGYASAFYFLSLTLRSIPVGVAYAIWAGVGWCRVITPASARWSGMYVVESIRRTPPSCSASATAASTAALRRS